MVLPRRAKHVAMLACGILATYYLVWTWFLILQEGASSEINAGQAMFTQPTRARQVKSHGSCAINFFGLPRGFESMVLPSIVANVLIPNLKYRCDFYIHYYHRDFEPEGRAGKGGKLNPNEIFLLKDKIMEIAASYAGSSEYHPTVEFTSDTEEDFWKQYNGTLEKLHTTKGPDGNYLYYPWKAKTYHYPESMDNIVKQWHSVQSAWNLMDNSSTKRYSRVAMLRLDVMYVLPVDIFQQDKDTADRNNKYAVSPGFALYPVNDRLVYGPYKAVQIWATERFKRLDHHVQTYEPGWGMHSERYLNHTIFTAIKDAGIPMVENPDLCMFRVRADHSAWISDCITLEGSTRGIKQYDLNELVEEIVGMECVASKLTRRIRQVHCLE